MKKIFFSIFLVFLFSNVITGTPLYNQNGVVLNHSLVKQKTLFINDLNRNVVIWKSTFELDNKNNKAIAVRIPCYLCYAYAYLNPAEISTVQNYCPDVKLSEVYKNYVANKPMMLNANQSIVSERYFATMDDVDLRTAILNWNFKFSFWY